MRPEPSQTSGMTPPIRPLPIILTTPEEVAASIPYELGFMPNSSVVVVFQDRNGAVVLTVRLDVPRGIGDEDFAGQVQLACRRAEHVQAVGCVVVLFVDSDVRSRLAVDMVREVSSVAKGCGLLVQGGGYQQAGRWFAVERGASAVVQPNRDGAVAQVQCQWIDRGVGYAPDRASLEQNVVGTANELSQAVARVFEVRPGPRDWPTRSIRQRRQVEESLLNFVLREYPASIRPQPRSIDPDPNWVATVGHAVRDPRVREPVLWRIADSHDSLDPLTSGRDLVAALCFLVRHTPREHRAAIASCAAVVAWQLGDGAMAAIAARHARVCDSTNVLSGLVLAALERGVPPTAWLHTIQSMELADLRSTRRRRERSLS